MFFMYNQAPMVCSKLNRIDFDSIDSWTLHLCRALAKRKCTLFLFYNHLLFIRFNHLVLRVFTSQDTTKYFLEVWMFEFNFPVICASHYPYSTGIAGLETRCFSQGPKGPPLLKNLGAKLKSDGQNIYFYM